MAFLINLQQPKLKYIRQRPAGGHCRLVEYIYLFILPLNKLEVKGIPFLCSLKSISVFKVTLVLLGLKITGLTKRYEETFYSLGFLQQLLKNVQLGHDRAAGF